MGINHKPPQFNPTLADVARKAGVGKTTVSRAINGARKVSTRTLDRINAAIRELHYQPSQAARSLKGEGTKAVGLIIPSISDPFFASCAEAAQAVVRSHGYLIVVASSGYDSATETDQIQSLTRHRVEGLLLASGNCENEALLASIGRLNIPIVAFNHPLQHASVQSVVCDNYGGGRSATEHLIAHGYRRILCLGGDSRQYSVCERQRGYLDAIQAAGLEPLVESSPNDYVSVEALLRAKWLVGKRIDAIFAVRNLITIYAFQTIQALGLKIPEDAALVGFDDFKLACTVRPAVTVVSQPVEALAGHAASLLFRQIQDVRGHTLTEGQTVSKFETTLIVRTSCGCP
ncbi:MAG: Transcriptional regulator, LacI family [Bryobacterales bacterium]|nr:Transcriptional regulator, LacI family [Bryobacterales bacterium]